MCGQRREQILQSREGRLGWASEEATPRDPELTGQCEQICSWEGTSDSVVGTREGAGRLVSCIESSEREGPTCSVTLARRSPPLSLCPHLPNRFTSVTLQGGRDDSR